MIKRAALLAGTFLPSRLRVALLRTLGFRVGRNVRIAPLTILVSDDMEIDEGAVIDPLSMIVAPKLRLGERSRIASFCRVIGHSGHAHFESQSFVALGCLIDTSGGFTLGQRSQLGPRSMYYSHGASGLVFNRRYPVRNGPITIGKDVWTGMGVMVYPRVNIGDGSIVFAGMLVTKNVDPNVALMPATEVMSHTVPVRHIQVGMTDDYLKERLLEHLSALSASVGSSVEALDGDTKRVHIPKLGFVVIGSPEHGTKGMRASDERAVFWVLRANGAASSTSPIFDFGTLEIRGQRSPLADFVADWLCRSLGIHFAYGDSPSHATVSPSVPLRN